MKNFVYVTVKVEVVTDSASAAEDAINECDYSFSHPLIKDTEIIGVDTISFSEE
jgi:hypothetical protein